MASDRWPPPLSRRSSTRPSTPPSAFELVDQAAHVARGAAVVLVAGRAGVEVLVEARHGDHADAQLLVAALDLAQFLLRGLRLERDLVARQHDDALLRAGRRAARQDLQPHDRAARAADQLHDVVEAPADHVDELAVLALADGDDAVVGLQLAVCCAEPPGRISMTVT